MHVPPTSFYSHALLVARSISMVQCHLQILDLTAMKAYRCVARRSGWSLGWKLRWEAAGQTNLVIYVDDFQPNSITRVVTFKRKGKCDDDIIAHRQKVSHPYTLFGVSIFPIPRLLWIRRRHRQSSSSPTQQVTSGIPT